MSAFGFLVFLILNYSVSYVCNGCHRLAVGIALPFSGRLMRENFFIGLKGATAPYLLWIRHCIFCSDHRGVTGFEACYFSIMTFNDICDNLLSIAALNSCRIVLYQQVKTITDQHGSFLPRQFRPGHCCHSLCSVGNS